MRFEWASEGAIHVSMYHIGTCGETRVKICSASWNKLAQWKLLPCLLSKWVCLISLFFGVILGFG